MKAVAREILEERFEVVGQFCEGLARVRKDDEEYHITIDGEPAYEERFESVDDFHEGVSVVETNCITFYIDRTGKWLAR